MLAPGTRIGPRYVIDRLLGQGGMSNLYIATDLQAGNAVRVIKEMTARYANPEEQEQAEKLFMREAQLLSQLNHPHIPKVFHTFTFQGRYYLSMEYCPGDDLGKLISDRGTIEEKWAAAWGAQMATVLYYLHRQNPPIVFRDVKPSNIMIVNEQVKLIDFGIARLFTSAKKGDTMRIGSPGYAPPEQYNGQTDPRSDIYALGVTLHHAVTGLDPTISQTPFMILPARSVNPKVSPEMEALITRATQLMPEKRYDNCLEMKRDLQVVMRNHGLMVGASVPFSAGVPGAPATPAAAAAVPPTAVATPQVAGSAPLTPPSPATSTATPATPPTPTPPPVPPTTASPARPRRSLAPLVGLAVLVVLGVGALQAPPEWRDAAGDQVRRVLDTLIPAPPPPVSAGQEFLLMGGPLPAAAEELGRAVRDGKATPEQVLDYQNALVYASGRPLVRLAVIAPADQKVAATIASWQRTSWNESNRDGNMLVVQLENVDKDWSGAVRRASRGERFREGKVADALLVFPPTPRPSGWSGLFKDTPPVYWVGPRQKDDPAAKTLETGETPYTEWLRQLQLGEVLWLAKEPAPPAAIKHESFPGPEGVAKLLKNNPKPVLVVDLDQLKGLESWPKVSGLRLVVFYPPGQLPAQPPAVPAGIKLYAVSQASAWSADPNVARFFSQGAAQPLFFDTLSWAGSQLLNQTRQTGLSWHTNRTGEVEPARWNLLEARASQWYWLREGGGK